MARWWTEAVQILKAVPRSGRTGSRFGAVFRLRDRGALDEALEKGLSLASDLFASQIDLEKPMAIVAAATVDEIAVRLGRPELARDVLERALALAEQEQAAADPAAPRKEGDYLSELDSYATRFRGRLALLRDDGPAR